MYIYIKIIGTGRLLGRARQNAWDKPILVTCPLKCLGHARSLGMLFKL